MEKRILIFDDDTKLQALLREYLEGYDFVVFCRPDGCSACQDIGECSPDLVILDIMMPGKDGVEVLRDIRSKENVPVIMLTARGDDSDRIVGLELGADDYLPKPFNPRELLARMKAVLRRYDGGASKPGQENILEAGGLRLDTSLMVLFVEGEELTLPSTECRLLAELMRNPDVPMSRDLLMDRVWGRDFAAYDRSIDVYISKLRQVLKSHSRHTNRIQTVWGTGYKFRG
ncbi:MAG: response regulator [Desulfovibrio sp.]|uniref:response regulator n=1 Tax=Desulfovibrio sp. 7SRBS1 TaxID=3378064 RepID=UPI003B3D5A26